MHTDVHSSLIHSGQDTETTKVSMIDDWLKKLWYIYTMECYLAVRGEILPYATTWMDLEIIILSDISQTKKAENHTISLYVGYTHKSNK